MSSASRVTGGGGGLSGTHVVLMFFYTLPIYTHTDRQTELRAVTAFVIPHHTVSHYNTASERKVTQGF